jgi:predicted ATPase/class 3 adenylate cyclase
MESDRSPETPTFVFTDIESSTCLWERFPDEMRAAVERHDAILRDAVEGSDGRVVKELGDGLMAVFSSAADGLRACLDAQRTLQAETWGATGPLRVRMGLHAGEAQARAEDFYGPSVNRAARIMAAGHGGQVLLSALTAELAGRRLPEGAALRDLGEHRLQDLFRPERIFQLVHPDLWSDFPPLATLGRRPNNLPTQTSEFLGREAQLSTIRDLLETAGVRLLTLTGPGGIGKTRLALQAAADEIDRFEDGVYLVDLSVARDADAAFEAIVRAAGLRGAGDGEPLELLAERLQGKRMLLLLDNFEQVMEAAEGLAELLRRCAGLKVLVTSREALRVRGEHLLAVPPLSLPTAAGARVSAEVAAASEAVSLFLERAREARPSFELTDENAAAIAEIVTRLDGLPLALELAAARLVLFAPDELRDRLRSRLEVLGRGPRDLPARQRTLRSTIEWSYELLDEEERAVFEVLAIFGPTRVEAVEEVVAGIDWLGDLDVVDLLASLVDKSFVRSVDARGSQRLSMLETIREYAAERLAEKPELETRPGPAQAGRVSPRRRPRPRPSSSGCAASPGRPSSVARERWSWRRSCTTRSPCLHPLPRRLPRPLAARAGARRRARTGHAGGRRGARLRDLEGSRPRPPGRRDDRPGAARGGARPHGSGHRPLPGAVDAADLLANDADAAGPLLQRALEAARGRGLRTPEPLAATRLARLRPVPGNEDETDALRAVYETFAEGFDTNDLAEARAVLVEANARVSQQGPA